MKLGQNVCFDEIPDEFENGLCRLQNWVTWSNFRRKKKTCVRSRGNIFSPIIMKLSQNVCLAETLKESENGSCRVKN